MKNTTRINERIAAHRVMLIDADGKNRGEMLKSAALDMARRSDLDLVEVGQGVVPVCKIMDYGKVQYEKQKAEKHKHHSPQMKEMRFDYKTEQHDLEIKKRKINEFLSGGHKVLVSMVVRGRERYVGRGAAKDKFIAFVKEFNPTLRVSDVSENERGYNTVVHPSSSATK
jgi:translation initiation factor IF-3